MSRVSVLTDKLPQIVKSITDLTGQHVLVGIPESKTDRSDETAGMTNASIGYVQEMGSPAQNIPARPFLVPGVERAKGEVTVELKAAANAALDGAQGNVTTFLNRAGIVAAQSAREMISSNIPPPLSPKTIAERYRSRRVAKRRQDESHYLRLVAQGMSPDAAQAATGIISLINTGQLRNALTYVVRKK